MTTYTEAELFAAVHAGYHVLDDLPLATRSWLEGYRAGRSAHQPSNTTPIASVKFWFHGECVIQALDPSAALPAGMALYTTPQPVVDVNQQLVEALLLFVQNSSVQNLVPVTCEIAEDALLSAGHNPTLSTTTDQ